MITLTLALLLLVPAEEAGRRAYAEGRFEQAREHFAAALAEPGAPRGRLLYNLGNCAYRLGRPAEAVLHYRRARLRLPRDRQLRFNLRLARQAVGLDPVEPEGFGPALLALLDRLRPAEQLLLAALVQALGLVGAVVLRRRWRLRLLLALVAALGLALGGRLTVLRYLPPDPVGVVVAPTLTLRAAPHEKAAAGIRLRAGAEVRVLAATDRWLRLEHPEGRGWTPRAGVGVVD